LNRTAVRRRSLQPLKSKKGNTMRTLLLLALCLQCGCMSNKICGGYNCFESDFKKLRKNCIEHMKDEPVGYTESRIMTMFPLMTDVEAITKTNEGYELVIDGDFCNGLFFNGSSTLYYDKKGNKLDRKERINDGGIFNIFSSETVIDNDSVYYRNESFLTNLIYSSYTRRNKHDNSEISKTNYLLNCFGSYKYGADEYIRLFWIPIKK